ncbi:MAG: hypothetical protein M1814_002745 [Vezdaea aestivalis]|nr:MAG: hypothetical protein M1814_002745 [Vezdaea aestivalis]
MAQPLSAKEASLFRQVVKFYEAKQTKKGMAFLRRERLKAAAQILKKHKHPETLAMQALLINSQGKHKEAMALGKEAVLLDIGSHVCWHVYGLLWRSEKNLDEAVRAYQRALKIEPESPQILRDLALLQVQMRDYSGYISSRRTMLTQRPHLRQNWTALALAHHLAGNIVDAEKVLTTYEETLKNPPAKSDLEHSEAVLYKNHVIADSGDIQKALEHLETIATDNLDRVSIMERKALYLLKLEKLGEAEKAYRALVERNPEYRDYYLGLEQALGLDRNRAEDVSTLKNLYSDYAEKSPRGDAARWIPLGFLEGSDFREAADTYLRRMLAKGAPSTFANVKGLYSDDFKKQTIHELVLEYEKGLSSRTKSDPSENSKAAMKEERFELAIFYFLAQHYNYHKSEDLDKAFAYIGKALEKSPATVEYFMTKARIWKHRGDAPKAAEVMEAGRKTDERDRAINTKAAKYQLRNHDNSTALQTMSKFTRNEAVGGTLGDLHDMQCVWFLTEDGESFLYQRELGLALKRFTSVYDIFDVWQEDQYDFHTFSLRKGQIRAYVDMIRWEDRLRDHPFYARTAIGATQAYILLHDYPALAHGPLLNGNSDSTGLPNGDAIERKKAEKKAKREKQKKEKAEADKKALSKASASTAVSAEAKREDPDPKGKKLVDTSTPLEDAPKFINPALAFKNASPQILHIAFELHLRREKWLLVLKCLIAANEIDKGDPVLHEQLVKFKQKLAAPHKPIDEKTLSYIKSNFTLLPETDSLAAWHEEFGRNKARTPAWVMSEARTDLLLHSNGGIEAEKKVFDVINIPSVTLQDSSQAYEFLKARKSKMTDAFLQQVQDKWPHAVVSGPGFTDKLAGLSI